MTRYCAVMLIHRKPTHSPDCVSATVTLADLSLNNASGIVPVTDVSELTDSV